MAFLGGSGAAAEMPDRRLLLLGTDAVSGVHHPATGALCGVINGGRGEHGLRCAVESLAGSVANLEMLARLDPLVMMREGFTAPLYPGAQRYYHEIDGP